jgi:hypothetical protein
VEHRTERVLIETPRYRIEGVIKLAPGEGYRSRLSDHVNDGDREFLIVLDAKLSRLDDPESASETDVLMLQKHRIDLIIPLDERPS